MPIRSLRKLAAVVLAVILAAGCGLRQETKSAPSELDGPLLFEDFETGTLGGGGWGWGDPVDPGTCVFSVASQGTRFGKYCGKIDFKPGKGWGCGAAEASSLDGRGLRIEGAGKMLVWIKAPDFLRFHITLTSRSDDRITPYLSPPQQGLGRWWRYEVPMDQFSRVLPAEAAEKTVKIAVVDSVGVFMPGGQKDGTLLVDDISFR